MKILTQMQKEMSEMKLLILSDKFGVTWIPESAAATLLGYDSARTLRRKVKSGLLPIDYTQEGKSLLYNRKSIDKHLLSNSTITKTI